MHEAHDHHPIRPEWRRRGPDRRPGPAARGAAAPSAIRCALQERRELLEVVLDLGRGPEARFPGARRCCRRNRSRDETSTTSCSGSASSARTIAPASSAPCTASRRSATARAASSASPAASAARSSARSTIIRDIVESGRSILLLGRPGVGKTTLLREAARVLADDLRKRVVIVDTSNEIAGDGDIPHPAIGRARRMQVPRRPCSTRS